MKRVLISFMLLSLVASMVNGEVSVQTNQQVAVSKVLSGVGTIQDVACTLDGTAFVSVLDGTGKLLKITNGSYQTLTSGLNQTGFARIVIDSTGLFQNDILINSPTGGSENTDPVYRIKENGNTSLLYNTSGLNAALISGCAIGQGGFESALYTYDVVGNRLIKINPSGTGVSQTVSHFSTVDVRDDMVISNDPFFGNYLYFTDAWGDDNKIIRVDSLGNPQVFAQGQQGFTLSFGTGLFEHSLYLGTLDGNIFKYDSAGSATLFATGFGNMISGIDFSNDSMWVSTVDSVYKIEIIPEPATLLLLGLGGMALRSRKS